MDQSCSWEQDNCTASNSTRTINANRSSSLLSKSLITRSSLRSILLATEAGGDCQCLDDHEGSRKSPSSPSQCAEYIPCGAVGYSSDGADRLSPNCHQVCGGCDSNKQRASGDCVDCLSERMVYDADCEDCFEAWFEKCRNTDGNTPETRVQERGSEFAECFVECTICDGDDVDCFDKYCDGEGDDCDTKVQECSSEECTECFDEAMIFAPSRKESNSEGKQRSERFRKKVDCVECAASLSCPLSLPFLGRNDEFDHYDTSSPCSPKMDQHHHHYDLHLLLRTQHSGCTIDPCLLHRDLQLESAMQTQMRCSWVASECETATSSEEQLRQDAIESASVHQSLESRSTFCDQAEPALVIKRSPPCSAAHPALVPAPGVSRRNRTCHWRMACGSVCGASFDTVLDLKKHIKGNHLLKGVVICSWQHCSATFDHEAALTSHVSKKHCTADGDMVGPWRCTVPGCSKSFVNKQVRNEHVASHGGTRAHCPYCNQCFNAEGSNFRKHLSLHVPKHLQSSCKHSHLGCKRRFPRLDNLRRHEASCKYGKAASSHLHRHKFQ